MPQVMQSSLRLTQDRIIPLPKITPSILSPMLPPSILIVLPTVDTVSGECLCLSSTFSSFNCSLSYHVLSSLFWVWSPLFPETHLGTFSYTFCSMLEHSWKCKRQAEFLINAYSGISRVQTQGFVNVSHIFRSWEINFNCIHWSAKGAFLPVYVTHSNFSCREIQAHLLKKNICFRLLVGLIKLQYHLPYIPGSIIGLIIHHVYFSLQTLYNLLLGKSSITTLFLLHRRNPPSPYKNLSRKSSF